MVGIVVVSHSWALAGAAVALAEEMLQGRPVPIVVAAGLDEQTFGTDAVRIHDALVEADQGDGVVVLMDLGSAVLSAELALELLEDDDARARVLLCPAPLVEGLVVAAVTALSGATRHEVAAEALAALTAKQSQLTPETPSVIMQSYAPPERVTLHDHGEVIGRFEVGVAHGLHARPAARVVQALRGVDARVELRNLSTGSDWVSGASLSRVSALGVLLGHEVEVRAAGPQAGEAVERLLALARRNFDEEPIQRDGDSTAADVGHRGGPASGASQPSNAATPGASHPSNAVPSGAGHPSEAAADSAGTTAGVSVSASASNLPVERDSSGPFPASPGIGIGPARLVIFARTRTELGEVLSDRPAVAERRRLEQAVSAVRTQIRSLRNRLARETSEADAGIFDAHLALLDDPELLSDAQSRIDAGQTASSAWAGAVAVTAAGLEALADPYQRARAADVRAVGDQVLGLLDPVDVEPDTGPGSQKPDLGGVLVAADLTPAQAAILDADQVTAVVLAFGSPTAHSAILARARGIPAVVGAGPGVLQIAEGTPLAVDGTTGELRIDPSPEVIAEFRQRASAAQAHGQELLERAGKRAVTMDSVEVLVGANIGSLEDARAATAFGADLVGLVRTEFLFLGRDRAPDVDEQETAYRALAEALDGRRITLRTLDVGGDKPLSYLPMPAEANPFLGVRGIRLALQQPRLLADQLLAIVRVAHDFPVSVTFPMVSTLAELVQARRVLDEAIKLAGRGEPAGLQVGIMVEVPAAALKAATFAPHLDFLSIGTNDLTQYTLAAERGNDAVSELGDPLDPGVLRLIDATCRGAGPALVAVCGELAANERAAALLVGLGVRELSVTPRAVPAVKQAVRDLTLPDAAALAQHALDAPSPDAVRLLLSGGTS